jgi:hypothetical protein
MQKPENSTNLPLLAMTDQGEGQRSRGQGSRGAEEQRSRGAEEQRSRGQGSRGAEEQRSRGAEEQRSRGAEEE